MIINTCKIDSLIPANYNPRKDLKPGDPEYDKLKRSIETFGYVEPVIVNDKTGVIVGGHQRLKVLKDLGYQDIEVVHVDLEPDKEKALNIALNKVSGEWDPEKLEDLLREINVDTDLDVTLTGFDLSELDTLFNGSLEDDGESEDDEIVYKSKKEAVEELNKLSEELNEIVDNPREIKLGDVYKLGNHIIMCGDSYDPDTLKKLIGNETPDMIFTDPPYNINRGKHGRKGNCFGNMCFNRKNSDPAKDLAKLLAKKIHDDGIDSIDVSKLEYMLNLGIKSIYMYCCRADLLDYLLLAKKYGYTYDVHVLNKVDTLPVHTSSYLNSLEYCVYMRSKGAIFNNKHFGYYYSRLVEEKLIDTEDNKFYSKVYTRIISVDKKYNNTISKHGTIKPLRMILPRIMISSNECGVVVDPFLGSGSTLIACERTNRRCFGVELLPKYMNDTIDRWEALTGKKAVKVESGDLDAPEYTEDDDIYIYGCVEDTDDIEVEQSDSEVEQSDSEVEQSDSEVEQSDE